jgi:hypothetical protein
VTVANYRYPSMLFLCTYATKDPRILGLSVGLRWMICLEDVSLTPTLTLTAIYICCCITTRRRLDLQVMTICIRMSMVWLGIGIGWTDTRRSKQRKCQVDRRITTVHQVLQSEHRLVVSTSGIPNPQVHTQEPHTKENNPTHHRKRRT